MLCCEKNLCRGERQLGGWFDSCTFTIYNHINFVLGLIISFLIFLIFDVYLGLLMLYMITLSALLFLAVLVEGFILEHQSPVAHEKRE